jgi:diguanylate cyclase (GGDEF)-like protein
LIPALRQEGAGDSEPLKHSQLFPVTLCSDIEVFSGKAGRVTSGQTETAAFPDEQEGSGALDPLADVQISATSSDRQLARQLYAAVFLLACVAILPGLALCLWTAQQFDSFAEMRERNLLLRSFEEEIGNVAEQQKVVTVWDDSVIYARARDRKWMDDNLGLWMHDFYGHDRIYVLDEFDAPVHSVVEGETLAPEEYEAVRSRIDPVVAEVRAALSGAEDPGGIVAQDSLSIAGHAAIVSVRPIIPSSEAIAFDPDGTYVHISVVYLNDSWLQRLGDRNQVSGARFLLADAPLPVQGGIEVTGKRSGLLGHVVWSPSNPGRELVRTMAPGLAVSVAALLGLIFWLLLRLRRAISQIHASKAEVQHLAFHDTLTGLPNRALFNDRLDQALARVRRGDGRIAVHYIDLDRFKYVNDTLGHPAGDDLIGQVAQRLNAITRRTDTVARLGGDEFVILQSGLRNWSASRTLAERTLEAIRQPFMLGSDQAFVGASIGIALAPDSATDRHELMRKADIALYQAKSEGKNRYCIFEDSFDEMVRLKRSVEHELRSALTGGTDLALVYQPFYAADGRTLCGAEALFRWNHPRHGMLSPSTLIAIAEERGLAADLGAWILREACATARVVDLPVVSVNISPLQFQDPEFPELLFGLLEEVGLPLDRLQLEIKESYLLQGGDTVGMVLERLRRAGVRIALDDFGSGYSSFRYLNRFRVDGIKIDRAFIQNLGEDRGTDALVQVMFDLARAFGIEVVAEGIETELQWERLRRHGTPNLQGFLFSRPLERDDLIALLRATGASAQPNAAAGF